MIIILAKNYFLFYKPHLVSQRKQAVSITCHGNAYFSKLLYFLKTDGYVAS